MHNFTSNSSVTINAVTQNTGVIRGEIYNATVGSMVEGEVSIEVTFLKDSDDTPVHHANYRVSEADLNAFEGTITLTATTVFERFEELITRYVLTQVDGMWGLTTSDWTLQAH